jgi:hypothetical protein
LPTRRALSVERQKVHAACSKGHPQREVMIQCANKLEKIMPDKDLQDELDRLRSENSGLRKPADRLNRRREIITIQFCSAQLAAAAIRGEEIWALRRSKPQFLTRHKRDTRQKLWN